MKITLSTLALLALATVAHAQANTLYGQQAGASLQNQYYVTAYGYQALYATTYGYGSAAFGANALRVSSGYYNTAMGYNSMVNGTSGNYNTALGAYSLTNLGTGQSNVAIGYNSGSCATVNGSNNIWINHCGLAKDNNVIRIGTQGTQVFTAIAGIYGKKLSAAGGQAVYVNSKGQLGVVSTKIVLPSAQPATQAQVAATQADITTLRTDLVATKNMVYQLQRDNVMLKAKLGAMYNGGDPTIRNH